ncbi:Repeat domain-containing protein [Pricia antarctica]|uniref:Repeat domain-containing protein n=1 Tax=Pricia antarctica TaxID=641691 RepID=A0A1G7FCJ9_9FLAO|nr:VCBS repeat-containing protein [Pricia antarctica]SDE73612.1 Repeat domain-containing protein [Pricia antarctica]
MRTILKLCLLITLIYSCQQEDDNKQFTLLSPKTTGINFKNLVQETEEFNVLTYGYLYNGGGVSIGDINNDSLPDIYFTGNMVGSHLYLNKGNFEFVEIAKEAGVFAAGLWNTGTTMADVNADGLLDIYVCRSAAPNPSKRKNLLFINNGPSAESGQVSFTEKASEYGIDDTGYSTQATFFDYDKDGDLDLYVLNHSTQEFAGFGHITASLKNKKNPSFSDKLYRNDNGKFTDVSEAAGLISNVLGFGLGLAISDINDDGWLDIYISNDYNEQDYLYINNQDGTFSENLEHFIGHTSLFSMGSDIADINNDGYTDIMTLDMLPEGNIRQKMVSGPDNYDKYQLLVQSGFYNQTMRNMLQLNNKGQSFSEIGQFSGISNTDWSWASLFADLDNDGFKDVFITNGYKRDYTNMDFMNFAVQEKLKENKTGKQTAITELLKNIPSTIEENYTYHNNGDLTFTKVNSAWGLDQKSLSNGAAYGDLDNDGDLDLVVNNIESAAFVYRNNTEKFTDNHYLKIQLKGDGKNTFGIGSKVTVHNGGQKLVQELIPTRGYQSSVDYTLVFGLSDAKQVDSLTVLWPDTRKQTLTNVKTNQTLLVQQSESKKVRNKEAQNTVEASNQIYFKDVSQDSLIPYIHIEDNYTDFKREQLLPHKLSTQGPKLTKGDVNGDGLDDIFIGGAKGSPGEVLLQTKKGEFKTTREAFDADSGSEDIDALFFDADNDGDLDLYVVSGSNEFEIDAPELQDRLYFNNGKGGFKNNPTSLPPMAVSGSCVTANDFDNDGDQDLFVGGRGIPGQYPIATRSYILKNDGNGNFKDITASVSAALESPGMVTDAIWTDFNGDGKADLMLVGEFMAIRAFENTGGRLTELNVNSGLTDSQGWWNRIAQGDFDNDGDMDYIVGNFGLNSQLKASPDEPVQMYYKDFDGNGSLDPIMTSYIMGESYPVFSKDDLLGQLSGLKRKYVNYSDYADEKITDIFTSEELSDAKILKAKNFATSYIENLGNNKFKVSPLPAPAQFSPIYGILAQDFNTDGNLDVILAGNFFGTRVKYGRYDANKGLLLLGNGKGNFEPVSTQESGLNIDGEIRDISSIQMADGKQLLLFARNDEGVKTYEVK